MTAQIIQGDCRDTLAGLPDSSINLIIADPPYGVNFVSRMGKSPKAKELASKIASDGTLDDALELWLEVQDLLALKAAPDCDMYVFTRWDIVGDWQRAIMEPFVYKMLLVWDKGDPGMGDIDANWGCGHELILYCKKGRRDIDHRRSGIIHVDKLRPSDMIHPTEKPVELMEVLIEMSSKPGDQVVDPFSGSGASVVAANKLGRNAIGCELDAGYAAKAQERLTEMYLF